jgi:hypothetical protein
MVEFALVEPTNAFNTDAQQAARALTRTFRFTVPSRGGA